MSYTVFSLLRGCLFRSVPPMNFNRRSPEEFQWKIFLGEDLDPILLAVLAVLSFAWEIVRDSPMVNIVSQKTQQPFMNNT